MEERSGGGGKKQEEKERRGRRREGGEEEESPTTLDWLNTRNLGRYMTQISSSCGGLIALGHWLVAFGNLLGALEAPLAGEIIGQNDF